MKILETIFVLMALTVSTALCQDYKLGDFVETELPKTNSKELHDLNFARNEFGVTIENGQVKIHKAGKKRTCTLSLTNGTLVGTDNGEWGGEIKFQPNGEKTATLVKEGNIKFIFRLKKEIFFIEGLAHMRVNSGAMYKLDTASYNFAPLKLFEFDDAPEAVNVFGDIIFVASYSGLFVIKGLKLDTTFENAFWTSLYPNSIAVVDEDNVYIGLRGGYAKVNVPRKEIKFFKFVQQ